jgi:hypothetical protein
MTRTLFFASIALATLVLAHDVPKGKAVTITGTLSIQAATSATT